MSAAAEALEADIESLSLPFGEFVISGGLPIGYNPLSPNPDRVIDDALPNASSKATSLHVLATNLPPLNASNSLDNTSLCFLAPHVKNLATSAKGFPRRLNNPDTPSYRIGESPGKGLGLFATRKIEAGEMICDERPLLVTPRDLGRVVTVPRAVQTGVSEATKHQVYRIEFEKVLHRFVSDPTRMSESNRNALLELCNIHSSNGDGSGPILGVIRTNCFKMSEPIRDQGTSDASNDQLGIYTGVWKTLSRMNHSCSPNTRSNWSSASFSTKTRASRTIEEGEEITVAYTNIEDTYEERAKALSLYKMVCTCSACCDPVGSDRRRLEIRRPIMLLAEDLAYEQIRKVELMEHEGLQSVDTYGTTLAFATAFFMLAGDREKVKKYGTKTYLAHCVKGSGKKFKMYRDLDEKSPEEWQRMCETADKGGEETYNDFMKGFKESATAVETGPLEPLLDLD